MGLAGKWENELLLSTYGSGGITVSFSRSLILPVASNCYWHRSVSQILLANCAARTCTHFCRQQDVNGSNIPNYRKKSSWKPATVVVISLNFLRSGRHLRLSRFGVSLQVLPPGGHIVLRNVLGTTIGLIVTGKPLAEFLFNFALTHVIPLQLLLFKKTLFYMLKHKSNWNINASRRALWKLCRNWCSPKNSFHEDSLAYSLYSQI